MSFSSDVKNELLNVPASDCCALAQNYALLLFGRAFSDSSLSLMTENPGVANAYMEAIYALSGHYCTLDESDAGNFRISTEDPELIAAIMKATGHSAGNPKRRLNFAVLQNECCFAAFVRGAFLSCGTVTDPEKEYHLEFSVPTKGLADDFMKLFDEFDPVPKITVRQGSYIIYFKNSSDIEDVLSIMGATENSMQLMGTKMYKDIRNRVNRKVNFENANLARTIAAATKQYEAIRVIIEHAGLDYLPEELRPLAKLRYENRELSNAEIAKLLPESITVSGINHRFQRIMRIADEITDKR